MGLGSCLGGVASGKLSVSFRDLERVVCSSIGHLRPRIREPEGDSAPASMGSGKRFDGCPGIRRWDPVSDLMGVRESRESVCSRRHLIKR